MDNSNTLNYTTIEIDPSSMWGQSIQGPAPTRLAHWHSLICDTLNTIRADQKDRGMPQGIIQVAMSPAIFSEWIQWASNLPGYDTNELHVFTTHNTLINSDDLLA